MNISKANEADAKAILNQAEAALKAGELSLIEFRKQEIIANTVLLCEKVNTEKSLQGKYAAETNYYVESANTQAQLGNYYFFQAWISDIEAHWQQVVKSESNAESCCFHES